MWFVFQIGVAVLVYWLLMENLDPKQDYGYAPGFVAGFAAFAATYAVTWAPGLFRALLGAVKSLRLKSHEAAHSVRRLFSPRAKARDADKLIDAVSTRENLR
jgi:hypothetical protein